MELLSKAASEIRVERRKVQQLLKENETLQEQLKTMKHKQAQAQRQQNNSAANKEAADLRVRYGDLMTVHKAMAVELEQTKEQVRVLQGRVRDQQKVLHTQPPVTSSRSQSPSTGPSHGHHTGTGYATRHGGRSGSAATGEVYSRSNSAQPVLRSASANHAQHQQQQAVPRAYAVTLSPSTSKYGRQQSSGESPFDAMASVPLSRGAGAAVSPNKKASRVVMVREVNSAVAGDGGGGGGHRAPTKARHVDPSAAAPLARAHSAPRSASATADHPGGIAREAAVAAEERRFNDMMLSRLRRAIAPPPTREQMAEVVHAMVQELVKSASRNGLRIDLKKVGPCLYECGAGAHKRRLHLSVDSRRLVVKCGGGHVDINEFIQRNRLWSELQVQN
jgi:hypothetical protein